MKPRSLADRTIVIEPRAPETGLDVSDCQLRTGGGRGPNTLRTHESSDTHPTLG